MIFLPLISHNCVQTPKESESESEESEESEEDSEESESDGGIGKGNVDVADPTKKMLCCVFNVVRSARVEFEASIFNGLDFGVNF